MIRASGTGSRYNFCIVTGGKPFGSQYSEQQRCDTARARVIQRVRVRHGAAIQPAHVRGIGFYIVTQILCHDGRGGGGGGGGSCDTACPDVATRCASTRPDGARTRRPARDLGAVCT